MIKFELQFYLDCFRAGFVASESLMMAKSHVLPNTSVSEWISSWQQSTLITNTPLADTLQVVANEGADGSNIMVAGYHLYTSVNMLLIQLVSPISFFVGL